MTVVLHDGRRFELVAHRPYPSHDDVELVLEGTDGPAAGTAEVHFEPGHRAEVTLFLRSAPASDEAGTVLLAEAAEYAARHGAAELTAPHVAGEPHALAILDGLGLGYHEHVGVDGPKAVIDLCPLLAWRALTPADA